MATKTAAACAEPSLEPMVRSPRSRDRVLRWTFRRGEETLLYELALADDYSSYELRLRAESSPAAGVLETFEDAASAIQRQSTRERLLIAEGWSLERFDSDRVER